MIGSSDHGGDINIWVPDPLALMLLLLVAFFYWRGTRVIRKQTESSLKIIRRRKFYFWCGWAALASVLGPPLDALGEVLFSAHMVQHEVMMLLAAPLLIMSKPGSALLRGMGRPIANLFGRITRGGRSVWPLLVAPMGAWWIHALGLWGWHLPVLFNAGLTNTWIHALQHLSFLLISLIFWYALLRPRRHNSGFGVLYVFTTALHTSVLGALLTFSTQVWYTPYETTAPLWGFDPIVDQQLGGLIMWVPGGATFVIAGLWCLAKLTQNSDDNTQSRPPEYSDVRSND